MFVFMIEFLVSFNNHCPRDQIDRFSLFLLAPFNDMIPLILLTMLTLMYNMKLDCANLF